MVQQMSSKCYVRVSQLEACTYAFSLYGIMNNLKRNFHIGAAPEMKSGDLSLMCQFLLKAGKVVDIRSRYLLVLQWQLFGRIAEVAALNFSDITLFEDRNIKCLQVISMHYKSLSNVLGPPLSVKGI
jgi:hypothetical protein